MLKASVELSGANAALDALPREVIEAVAAKVKALTINLQHHIVADKLQGQVLHHRSGNLGRSIQEEVETSGATTTGQVYSSGDVKYAAIHEFGFHGIENVREHIRTVAFGREVAPFIVHGFQRQVNMPERSFMRSSLADHAEIIIDGIRAAAIAGAREAMAK